MTEKREDYHAEANMGRGQSVEIFTRLYEPMPAEALKVDDSRGFPLTSIKAAYILERLNQVFGLLGYGWRYSYAPHHIESAGGKEEVLVEVALQWRVCEAPDGGGCPPLYWSRFVNPAGEFTEGWHFENSQTAVWSEPVFSTGGSSATRKGSTPLKDAFQGAVTNGITKAASRLGVGLEVFKGQDNDIEPAPSRAKAKANAAAPKGKSAPKTNASPKATTGESFATLTAMQSAAQAAVAKLRVEGDADAKTVQALAHKMDALGLKMQTTRLLQALLGEGEFSQARIMGIYNFLLSAKLTAENIDTLNASAWEGFPEPEKAT